MANFKLTQTGAQIQADLDLLDSNSATQGQILTANGTGGASWQNASGGGTEVIANPTLAGTEADLTGLSVNGTKYKVPTGGSGGGTQLYKHIVECTNRFSIAYFIFASTSNIQFDGTNGMSIPIVPYYENNLDSTIYNVIGIGSNQIFSYTIDGGLSLQTVDLRDYDSYIDNVTPL